MEHRVLLIDEVAALLRIAPVTIYRHLAQRRKGIGNFPLPLSSGGKHRWNAEDIEQYIRSQSNSAPPNISNPAQSKREAKAYKERQEAARQVLERHRVNRSSK